MHSPAWEAELWASFPGKLHTFNFLDLPARSTFLLHNDGEFLFLTLGRLRTQTAVFWWSIPSSKGTCHHPAHTHTGPVSHMCPQRANSAFVYCLDQGERGPDQRDPEGAGGSSGMHIFQSKNGSQPTSPAQHQPFP